MSDHRIGKPGKTKNASHRMMDQLQKNLKGDQHHRYAMHNHANTHTQSREEDLSVQHDHRPAVSTITSTHVKQQSVSHSNDQKPVLKADTDNSAQQPVPPIDTRPNNTRQQVPRPESRPTNNQQTSRINKSRAGRQQDPCFNAQRNNYQQNSRFHPDYNNHRRSDQTSDRRGNGGQQQGYNHQQRANNFQQRPFGPQMPRIGLDAARFNQQSGMGVGMGVMSPQQQSFMAAPMAMSFPGGFNPAAFNPMQSTNGMNPMFNMMYMKAMMSNNVNNLQQPFSNGTVSSNTQQTAPLRKQSYAMRTSQSASPGPPTPTSNRSSDEKSQETLAEEKKKAFDAYHNDIPVPCEVSPDMIQKIAEKRQVYLEIKPSLKGEDIGKVRRLYQKIEVNIVSEIWGLGDNYKTCSHDDKTKISRIVQARCKLFMNTFMMQGCWDELVKRKASYKAHAAKFEEQDAERLAEYDANVWPMVWQNHLDDVQDWEISNEEYRKACAAHQDDQTLATHNPDDYRCGTHRPEEPA